ncbi:MAG: hypothetical protein FWF35_04765 [Elusimicrobia bacterium]|nr:hypothetical protein [Elusimicrobiota bacterium]
MKIKIPAFFIMFLFLALGGAAQTSVSAAPAAQAQQSELQLALNPFISNLDNEFEQLGYVLKYYKNFNPGGKLISYEDLDSLNTSNKAHAEEAAARADKIAQRLAAVKDKTDKTQQDFEDLQREIYDAAVELNALKTVDVDSGVYDNYNIAVVDIHKFLADKLTALSKNNVQAVKDFQAAR